MLFCSHSLKVRLVAVLELSVTSHDLQQQMEFSSGYCGIEDFHFSKHIQDFVLIYLLLNN